MQVPKGSGSVDMEGFRGLSPVLLPVKGIGQVLLPKVLRLLSGRLGSNSGPPVPGSEQDRKPTPSIALQPLG